MDVPSVLNWLASWKVLHSVVYNYKGVLVFWTNFIQNPEIS